MLQTGRKKKTLSSVHVTIRKLSPTVKQAIWRFTQRFNLHKPVMFSITWDNWHIWEQSYIWIEDFFFFFLKDTYKNFYIKIDKNERECA